LEPLILTVRNYAAEALSKAVSEFSSHSDFVIQSLTDDQIKEFIADEYQIKNHTFQDRIIDIAGGNPRLAVMASKIALEQDGLSKIGNVANLYDLYFGSSQHIERILSTCELSKVAGIIALYRIVDKSNTEQMQKIENVFKIQPDEFWQSVLTLDAHEVVELHENEVVRISDQVIATYLFYDCVFRQKNIDFKNLLHHFSENQLKMLADTVTPTVNAFDGTNIVAQISPQLEQAFANAQNNEKQILNLLSTFWWVIPTKSIKFIKAIIHRLNVPNIDWNDIKFKTDNKSISSDSRLELLIYMFRFDEICMKSSCIYFLDYIERVPQNIGLALYALDEYFGYEYNDLTGVFNGQDYLLEQLWKRAKEGNNTLYSRLFISYSATLLKIKCKQNSMKGNTCTIRTFELVLSSENIQSTRRTIWNRLSFLMENDDLRGYVIEVLQKHRRNLWDASEENGQLDTNMIREFIFPKLNVTLFNESLIALEFIDFDKDRGNSVLSGYYKAFETAQIQIYKLLNKDRHEQKMPKMGFDEFHEYYAEKVKLYVKGFTPQKLLELLKQCVEIKSVLLKREDNIYWFEHGVQHLINGFVAATNIEQLIAFIEQFYIQKVQISFNPYTTIKTLMETKSCEFTSQFIANSSVEDKIRWQLLYFAIKTDLEMKVLQSDVATLHGLLELATPSDIPPNPRYLLQYQKLDKALIANILQVFTSKEGLDVDGS
jgi:hypothetical protein